MIATVADVSGITRLLNEAYRGEHSKKGWTTEAHLIAGNTRTNEEQMSALIQMPGSVFLIFKNNQQVIEACVNLQQQGDIMYLGMLAVAPLLQNSGLGKMLLRSAETHALTFGCGSILMTVIAARTELIAWYQRHGYEDTGTRKEFVEDNISGKHLAKLEFMLLKKRLAAT